MADRPALQSSSPNLRQPCPHCGYDIPPGAMFCPHCTRRVLAYEYCSECREPVSIDAKYCPYCSQRIRHARPDSAAPTIDANIEIRASRLGCFLTTGSLTALFHPPVIHAAGDRVRMTSWSMLGLRIHDQEIRIERIASVRTTKGIFWDALIIETFGGTLDEIGQRGLRKSDARRLASIIKAALTDGSK
ncbi:MAG: zinc ribbon domain-containing protein [Phycisphaerales bacterium]|nr:zinc ribbon domain-containing protein [Phycisphaerales bacterium]